MRNGFTLVELLGVIVIFGIVLSLTVVGYNNINEKIDEIYYFTLEEEVLSSARDYFYYNHELPQENNQIKSIDVNQLVINNYIEKIYDKSGMMCNLEDSVVTVKKDNDEFKYNICLKCGDKYESKNC